MFLKRVPTDSKIIITFIACTLFGAVGVGGRKLMYDPDVVILKNKNTNVKTTNNNKNLKQWD